MWQIEETSELTYTRAEFRLADGHRFMIWPSPNDKDVCAKVWGTNWANVSRIQALFPESTVEGQMVRIPKGDDTFIGIAEKIATEFGVQC